MSLGCCRRGRMGGRRCQVGVVGMPFWVGLSGCEVMNRKREVELKGEAMNRNTGLSCSCLLVCVLGDD